MRHAPRRFAKTTRTSVFATCLVVGVLSPPWYRSRWSNLLASSRNQENNEFSVFPVAKRHATDTFNPQLIDTETYSSFRCLGGSQTFPDMNMQHSVHVYQGWPASNNNLNRMISTGQNPLLWSPLTKSSPLPRGGPLLTNATFLLNGNSNSDNFAHLLVDDLIPSLTALSLFDLPLDSGQLLSQYDCRKKMQYYNPKDVNPITHRSRSDVCRENFELYTPLVLGRNIVDPTLEWNGTTVCMKQMIAGQSSVFSIRSLDVERGHSLRVARDVIVQRLGLGRVARPAFQNVMVLLKQPNFATPTWSTLCEDTRTLVRGINPTITVRCFNPVLQSIQDQVLESLRSSLIVTEHGATSYGALYGHDGVVLLSIATKFEVKDTHIHLYANHYETYYFAAEDKATTFEGMLRFTLAKAASNFGFNTNCAGLCVP